MNEPKNKEFVLYDVEININSILEIQKGWDITFSKEGKQKFEEAKKLQTKIFSVIGNKNRGKSYVLSKISGKDLPRGYNVTTKGISISFPDYDYDDIAVFDSAGLESPLLESDSEQYRLKSEDEKKNQTFYEELEELRKEIKAKKESKCSLKELKILENKFFKKKNEFYKSINNKDEQIESLTNERKITDFFLQRFIIENANIILLVVEKLSIEDQFFLNKITKLIKDRKIFLQKIIVIHNIKKMKHKKDVQDYIKETLKKSLTFSLHEEKKQILKSQKEYNEYVYIEQDVTSSNEPIIPIIHVIMAQEGSEAGNYYNDAAIEFIKRQGETFRNIKEFDLEDRLKKFFCNISETILKFEDDNEKINPENIKFEIDQDNNNKGKIVLDYKKNISLEIFCGDILSETFGEEKFCPEYSIESNENEILIYLDCPGNTCISKAEIKYVHNYTNLIIAGKREKNNIKTMGRKFGSGEFELKINLHDKGNICDDKIINIKKLGNKFNGFYKFTIQKAK